MLTELGKKEQMNTVRILTRNQKILKKKKKFQSETEFNDWGEKKKKKQKE